MLALLKKQDFLFSRSAERFADGVDCWLTRLHKGAERVWLCLFLTPKPEPLTAGTGLAAHCKNLTPLEWDEWYRAEFRCEAFC